MAMASQRKVVYDFGEFRLDPAERLLLRRKESVSLTPRAFDTLLLLVENSGHMLRKEELIEKLWPDSFVGDNSLAQNISALRKALDDGAGGQQFVETVPRVGYRFTADVKRVEQSETEPIGDNVVAQKSEPIATQAPVAAEPTALETDAADSKALSVARPLADISSSRVFSSVTAKPAAQRLILGAVLALALAFLAGLAYAIFIRKSGNPSQPAPLRLAVLPFRNLKQDPEMDFLSFSLADAVINKLGYVKTLEVRPSASIEKYRNQAVDPPQVANELKVELLLTGSFIKEGDDLRIMSQLVNVKQNEIVWQASMDLKYDKLLTVQDEVTAQVIRGLRLNLTPAEQQNLTLDTPANALAYDYYLHGVDHYARNNFSMAVSMLEKSVELDPTYALAWAHLGRAYNARAAFALGGREAYEKAFAAYEKALSLNPQQVEPRIFMANTYTDTGRVQLAIPLLRETLVAHPNLAEAHWELGYAYRFGGMLQESIQECERARQLDPAVKINSSALNSYLYTGNYTKFLQSLPPTETNAYIIFYRGFANYYLKNWNEATNDFDRAYQLDPSLYSRVGAALSKGLAGQNQAGLDILRDLENVIQQRNVRDAEGIYKVAQAYAVLGDKVSASRVLRNSIEGGFVCYPYFISDPLLENLRGESEYDTLMALARKRHEEFKQSFFPDLSHSTNQR